jgi:hypothetical protein
MSIKANINARKAAEKFIVLAEMVLDEEEDILEPVYWECVAKIALEKGGKPRIPDKDLGDAPMDDREALQYGERVLGFGKYPKTPIADVPLDYLDWLHSARAVWLRDLNRYLSSAYVQRQRDQLYGHDTE